MTQTLGIEKTMFSPCISTPCLSCFSWQRHLLDDFRTVKSQITCPAQIQIVVKLVTILNGDSWCNWIEWFSVFNSISAWVISIKQSYFLIYLWKSLHKQEAEIDLVFPLCQCNIGLKHALQAEFFSPFLEKQLFLFYFSDAHYSSFFHHRTEYKAYRDVKPTKMIRAKSQYLPPVGKTSRETSYSATYNCHAPLQPADNKAPERRRMRSWYCEPYVEPIKQVRPTAPDC